MENDKTSLQADIATVKLRLINVPDSQVEERIALRMKLAELNQQLAQQRNTIKEQILEI